MNEKNRNPIDTGGTLARTGLEIVVPSHEVPDDKKTPDVMTIDCNNQQSSARHQYPAKQATGPRTEPSRQCSSLNALKHGIFSEATLLKGESRAQFDRLRTQLWEALRPEGAVEELHVDKLVSLWWRSRRLLLAEAAEIRKNTEFLESDKHAQQSADAEGIGRSEGLDGENGLMSKIHNPEILAYCLKSLMEMRDGIRARGFDEERDTSILDRIYGEKKMTLRENLRDHYQTWSETAKCPEEERTREGYATSKECTLHFLDAIDDEIKRLQIFHKKKTSVEAQRISIEMVRQGVPDGRGLDRLLRYETSLERSFDRTWDRLERLQRLRLGQPVTPRLEVRLS